MACKKMIDDWLRRNRDQIFTCPVYSGSPRISRLACVKRYALATREKAVKKGDQSTWTPDEKGWLFFVQNLFYWEEIGKDCFQIKRD